MEAENKLLKDFLFERMYRHTQVNRQTYRAHHMIEALFTAFMNHRKMLPPAWRVRLPEDTNDDVGKARVVCDYLASLTDRSASLEHRRMFGGLEW